jgi:hypothetical protein
MEERLADADVLLKDLKPAGTTFDGGPRGAAPTGGMDGLIRRKAGRG